jgi:Domain of unknown function (DUF4440)
MRVHLLYLSSLCVLFLAGFSAVVLADDPKKTDTQLTAVQAADDARLAAMRMPQREKLDAIFSDSLHYAHSSGTVDTKSSFIEVLTAGKTKYLDFKYEKRDFTFPTPDMALMTGRVRVRVTTADTTQEMALSFLGVWRLENGTWRFLAWQSCKMPT